MKDLKQKLRNAGFEEDEHRTMSLKTKRFKIWQIDNNQFRVNKLADYGLVLKFEAETKEELSKMCYPFVGKDLDFSPKKTYQWKVFYNELARADQVTFIDLFQKMHKAAFLSYEQKLSIVAGLKLRVIVDAINADFTQKVIGHDYGVHRNPMGGKITWHCNFQIGPLVLNNQAAAEMLIQTNLPLLNDYLDKNATI